MLSKKYLALHHSDKAEITAQGRTAECLSRTVERSSASAMRHSFGLLETSSHCW